MRFGHVQALQGVDFAARRGRVTALIGDNGAGKSTLVKVLSGAIRPDQGEVALDGQTRTFSSPQQARQCGIETVFQSLALAPDLTPAANLFMGRELPRPGLLGRLGFLDDPAMRRAAQSHFTRLGADLADQSCPIRALSGGQRQSVAICRALVWSSRAVILDEPTAALGVRQTGNVLSLIRRVRDEGRAVILISHNMPNVLDVADDIEVLRLGRRVGRFAAAGTTINDLVTCMTSGTELRSAA